MSNVKNRNYFTCIKIRVVLKQFIIAIFQATWNLYHRAVTIDQAYS